MNSIRHILIVKPSSLGDIIHTLPVLPVIRAEVPGVRITWVVSEQYAGLLALVTGIDHIITFNRERWIGWSRWRSFVQELRRLDCDLSLDFQGLFRSGLISRLSGADRRVGFHHAREGAGFFYNKKIMLPAGLCHAVDRNLFLVRSVLGTDRVCGRDELGFAGGDSAEMDRLLGEHGLTGDDAFIAVAPGARWEAKIWPPGFFSEVLSRVWRTEPELPVLMLGALAEKPLGEAIAGQCAGKGRLVNLMGRTDLGTLVAVLGHTKTLLTNDSGPMHIAALLGTPVTALFGPTDPELTGPYGSFHRVFRGGCEEGPCLAKKCPRGSNACHDTVAGGEVADAVLDLFYNH